MRVVWTLSATSDAAEIIKALASFAWPALVLFGGGILWWKRSKLTDVGQWVAGVIGDRSVSGRVGGLQIDVGEARVDPQTAVDDQRAQIESLRAEVSLLAQQLDECCRGRESSTAVVTDEGLVEEALPKSEPRRLPAMPSRVLWVDDTPEGNTYERAVFTDRGVAVEIAVSSREAMRRFNKGENFDLVISNMRRADEESGDEAAGIRLLRWLTDLPVSPPLVFYASPEAAEHFNREVLEIGAIGITGDPTTLFELSGLNLGPASAQAFEQRVVLALRRMPGVQAPLRPAPRGIDFEITRGNSRIAIEAKAWFRRPSRSSLERTLERLGGLADSYSEVWLVVPRDLPVGVREDAERHRIKMYTLADLKSLGD